MNKIDNCTRQLLDPTGRELSHLKVGIQLAPKFEVAQRAENVEQSNASNHASLVPSLCLKVLRCHLCKQENVAPLSFKMMAWAGQSADRVRIEERPASSLCRQQILHPRDGT